MDKLLFRKEIINKRKALSFDERIKLSDAIVDKLLITEEYINADIVLIYADANGEVATDRLILTSLLKGKRVYAPVCGDEFTMDFYEIFALDELYPGSYGIREPLTIENLRLTESVITDNTLAIVPGLVFDKNNNRMGYGKGYYDRFFAKIHIPNRLALAYDFQLVDQIETGEYDIPMTKIITN